jgi:hypothetical protein
MAVHYIKFPMSEAAYAAFRSGAPVSLEVEHLQYSASSTLPEATLQSLRDDFV